MSDTDAATDDDRGTVRSRVTPPVDAVATVTVDGDAITTLAVPADATLEVATTVDDRKDLDDGIDTDDVPAPAYADDLDDPHESFVVGHPVWVTVTVADERSTPRFTAAPGETVAVHLEQADGDIEAGESPDADANPGGSTP